MAGALIVDGRRILFVEKPFAAPFVASLAAPVVASFAALFAAPVVASFAASLVATVAALFDVLSSGKLLGLNRCGRLL